MFTMRTKPLSELDFSLDYTSTSYSEYQISDLVYTGDIQVGKLTADISVGVGNAEFLSESDAIIMEPNGNYVATNKGTAICTIGCLTRGKELNPLASDPAVKYVEGSFGDHLNSVYNTLTDGVAVESGTVDLFSSRDEVTGAYTWNEGCWAYPVNLTCMAPWRDKEGVGSSTSPNYRWPVTAITPRAVVCGHVRTWIGEGYHFFGRDNVMHKRRVVAIERIQPESDIYSGPYFVALLDSDLPDDIVPAKLLPHENDVVFPIGPAKFKYISRLLGDDNSLFTISTNGDKEAISNPIEGVEYGGSFGSLFYAVTGDLLSGDPGRFNKEIVSGDSSSPSFLQVNSETVLLSSYYTGVGGMGLYYSAYYLDICKRIDKMCRNLNIEPKYPEIVSLSAFTKYTDYYII